MKNKQIHVLWINEQASLVGGAEHYIHNTASELKNLNVRSTLLYSVHNHPSPKFISTFEGVFPMVDMEEQIKEISPDIIFIHQLDDTACLQVILDTGIKTIKFYHDHKLFCLRNYKYTAINNTTCVYPSGLRCYKCLGFINKSDSVLRFKFSSLSTLKKQQHINKKIDAYVVGSHYMKEHIIEHGFNGDKINVLPLYSTSPIKTFGTLRKDFLFAGQLVRGKGLDILLNSFKRVNTTHKLIICGSGKQKSELQSLSRKLGVSDRVEWKGNVTSAALRELYAKVICVIMPSREPETFGLTGLEAMSAGTPVIASKVGGISEWLDDGITGLLVPSCNIIDLAKAMQMMNDNEIMRDSMGNIAQKIYLEKFSQQKHVTSLLKLFKKMMLEAQ